jgi:hypothetical protein
MNSQLKFTSFIIAASALSLACTEDVGSEDIRTGGLYARYEAVGQADGTTDIEAQIRVGGDSGTWVQLNNGEKLEVSIPEETMTLNHNEQGDRHYYRGELGTNKSVEINVALLRTDADIDAPNSKATLPAPFTAAFTDIDGGDSVTRGEDIEIKWDKNASGNMDWEVTGDCIWTESGSTNDDGAFTISAESIAVQNLDKGDSCEVTVTLERINTGSVDKEFGEGGQFEAIQRRQIQFVSTPADGEVSDPTNGAGGSKP